MRPMARTEGILVEHLSEEVMVYDLQHDDVHCLNRVAAWVWEHCDGVTSIADLSAAAVTELGLPNDPDVIFLALEELEAARLLAEPLEMAGSAPTISRRELTRRFAAAGVAFAVALPIITTLGAPTPLQAQSLASLGEACTVDAECQSTCCDLSVLGGTCQDALALRANCVL